MTRQKPRPFLPGALLLSAALASISFGPNVSAQTAGYATQVVGYTAGTAISATYTNANSALGQPGGNVDGGTLNPFVSNYRGAELPEPGTLALCGAAVAFGLWLRFKRPMVRKALLAGCVAVGLGVTPPDASAQMLGFGDIRNWTGTGSNEAALVVDWNDGKAPESIVWGFRWNGTATGLDMFNAIDLADSRLALFTSNDPQFGAFVFGVGYDLNANGGNFTPGQPRNEIGSASDPADHYAEGYYSKYWAYYNSDSGSPYGGGGAWRVGDFGASGRTLVNGSWDGWSISDADFNAPDPGFPSPAAVPEPAAWWTLGLGLVFAVLIARPGRRGATRA